MKKTMKIALAIALMMVMLISLAGCGKKEEKKEEPANNIAVVDPTSSTIGNEVVTFTGDQNMAIDLNTTVNTNTTTTTTVPTTTTTTVPTTTTTGDKIVAYKDIAAGESSMGETREIIEVTYAGNVPSVIVVKMEFADASTPATYASILQSAGESIEGMTITAEGNYIVMTMNAQAFMDEEGYDADEITKEALIQELRADGFTVQ